MYHPCCLLGYRRQFSVNRDILLTSQSLSDYGGPCNNDKQASHDQEGVHCVALSVSHLRSLLLHGSRPHGGHHCGHLGCPENVTPQYWHRSQRRCHNWTNLT